MFQRFLALTAALFIGSALLAAPATTGAITTDPFNSGCLQPSGNNGLAVISPACRADLATRRDQVNAGGFVNNQPTIDGDRRLGYLWAFSASVQQQLAPDVAISLDYVGNRGYDQTALIDINKGPAGANGRITRLGADGFDPAGELIPAGARSTNFIRVLQYQALDARSTPTTTRSR